MIQTTLVLATPTKAEPTLLSQSEAVKKHAASLASKSICVDVSTPQMILLHSLSNRTQSTHSIRLDFPAWAYANNIRVDTSDYHGFLHNLPERVMSRLPQVLGSSFKPIPAQFFTDHTGALLANTYAPFKPNCEPTSTPAILTEYWERVFANETDRLVIQQWAADIIQNPTRRPQWTPLITGVQGCGKSTLSRLIHLALGKRHTWENNKYSAAFKQFSEVLPNNLLVVFDDAKADQHTYGTLKLEITRSLQPVEIKGQQRLVEREVYARVLILHNGTRPIPGIEEGDRRLYATERITHANMYNPDGLKANTDAFFKRFNAFLESPESPSILYHFFMGVDTVNFNHANTVQTDTLRQMIDLGKSVLGKLIENYVEDRPCFHDNQIYEYLKVNNIQHPNLDIIKSKLTELNYTSKRRIVEGCGTKQQDIWTPNPPQGKTKGRSITDAEAEAIADSIRLRPTSF